MWVHFTGDTNEYEAIESMHAILVIRQKTEELSQSTTANVGNTTTKTNTKIKITNPSAVKLVSVKNLKGNYVRVRTYKTVSGKNYYSKWSNVKKVKIKK